jgi:GNAT superfamily N-acetyltransferase
MMSGPIVVERSELASIAALREAHRRSASCQIVRDSMLPRGLAEPWAVFLDGGLVGYAGLWVEHFPGRLMELVLSPSVEGRAPSLLAAVADATGAREMECQTNLPLLHGLFRRFVKDSTTEHLLFEDDPDSPSVAGASEAWTFRARRPRDGAVATVVPEGPWVVEEAGRIVAAGGILTHYNPPYADLYLEVVPDLRGQGVGRFLVRELRRVAKESGLVPAARCDPGNEASRRALTAGGMRSCGALLSGRITRPYRRDGIPSRPAPGGLGASPREES